MRITQNKFLYISSILTQSFGLFTFFIVGSFYSPSDYADYSFSLSVASVLSIIMTLRVENQLLRNQSNDNLSNFGALAFLLLVGVLAIGSLLGIVSDASKLYFTTLLVVLVYTNNQILIKFLNALSDFKLIGFIRILQQVLFITLLFFLRSFHGAIVLAYLISMIVAQSLFFIKYLKFILCHSNINMNAVKTMLKIVKNDVFLSTPLSLLYTLVFESPNIVLRYTGLVELQGLYSFYYRLTNKVVSVLSENMTIEVNSMFREGSLSKNFFDRRSRLLIVISLVVCVLTFLGVKVLLSFFDNWNFDLWLLILVLFIAFSAIVFEPFKLIVQLQNQHIKELSIVGISFFVFISFTFIYGIFHGNFNFYLPTFVFYIVALRVYRWLLTRSVLEYE